MEFFVVEEDPNYDDFFKTCKRINLRGFIWNLYKPISEDEGSLYHQITTNPRQTPVSTFLLITVTTYDKVVLN